VIETINLKLRGHCNYFALEMQQGISAIYAGGRIGKSESACKEQEEIQDSVGRSGARSLSMQNWASFMTTGSKDISWQPIRPDMIHKP
jgi:hypothetical protein